MRKKRILISSYNLEIGGIETSLINLLRNISLDKFDVTLILEEKKGIFINDIPKDIVIKQYKVSNIKNVFIRKIINLFNRLRYIIENYRKYDVSICYATYSGPCGFVARVSSNNRILFVHSNYYQLYNQDENKVKVFFDKRKIQKYNHIVFVSNESKDDLCMIYPSIKDKAITINNIVDYKKIIDLSKEKVNIKKTTKKVFLFVGRLEESSKRLTLLLDVAKKCQKNKINAMFWIVGNGPDEKKYKNFVKKEKLNNVLFFGVKKNPYPYFKACDYLILTSKYEGFPVVYNEAIIFNKPIVTTIDVSDDYISIPNRFGFIVNEEDIYNKIKELSLKKQKIKEKVDFELLNKKRMKLIEKIMESK